MSKIRRNDPCSCGSGKKYKNCCGKNQVVSLARILNDEIMNVQMEIVDFAISHYPREIKKVIEESEFPMEVAKKELGQEIQEFIHFMLMNWVIFEVPVEDERRIIDLFIQHKSPHIKRERLREILVSWGKGSPFVGKLVSKEVDDLFLVEHLIHKHGVRVQVLEGERYQETEIGSLIIGFLVPINDYTFTFFTTFVNLPSEETDEFEDDIQTILYGSPFSLEDERFFSSYFPEILATLFFDREPMLSPQALEWDNPAQEMVADLYYARIHEEDGVPESFMQFGLVLWKTYCERVNPTMRKPKLFAAGLHYLVGSLFPINNPTQKQLADIYGISSSSLSNKYREIEMVVEDLIEDFFEKLRGEDEGALDLDRLINSLPPSMSKEEQAEVLIDHAYQADRESRAKLANQAIALDPMNPDAYNLLGDVTTNYDRKLELFQKGMDVGEQMLGSVFIEEEKGHLWGFLEARPYMRVKLSYADTLLHGGELKDAIAQYKELLELNEGDNQGVRYRLFVAYIETRRLDEAENLLDQYSEDNTANDLYNRCLVEALRNGKSSKYKELLAQAEQQNPYVMPYLRKEKKMPREAPDTYSLGDPSEAVIYVDLFGHLWWESKAW